MKDFQKNVIRAAVFKWAYEINREEIIAVWNLPHELRELALLVNLDARCDNGMTGTTRIEIIDKITGEIFHCLKIEDMHRGG